MSPEQTPPPDKGRYSPGGPSSSLQVRGRGASFLPTPLACNQRQCLQPSSRASKAKCILKKGPRRSTVSTPTCHMVVQSMGEKSECNSPTKKKKKREREPTSFRVTTSAFSKQKWPNLLRSSHRRKPKKRKVPRSASRNRSVRLSALIPVVPNDQEEPPCQPCLKGGWTRGGRGEKKSTSEVQSTSEPACEAPQSADLPLAGRVTRWATQS